MIARISDTAIDVAELQASVSGSEQGAIASFLGVVRNHDHGREVVALEYSAHPSAAAVIAQLASDAAELGGAAAVAVSHRTGRLEVGEIALACFVSAAHRKAALDTCAQLVEDVKAHLPIWKCQYFVDGTSEWVNCA